MAVDPPRTLFATSRGCVSVVFLRGVPLARPLAIALLAVASVGAQAQDAKVSKEREALRRAQAVQRRSSRARFRPTRPRRKPRLRWRRRSWPVLERW
jgi:hypothetical protein